MSIAKCPACGKPVTYEEEKSGGCFGCGIVFKEYWEEQKRKESTLKGTL